MEILTLLNKTGTIWLFPLLFKTFVKIKERISFPYLDMSRKAMDFVKSSGIKGDYLEFGVYKGGTFTIAFHLAQRRDYLKDMNFYAFDSFEGLPVPKGIDKEGPFRQKDYYCNVDDFKKNLSKNKVDLKKVRIIKGWYADVLNEKLKKRLFLKKAAIIWIDCDLYHSVVPVLDFITDYVQDGCIIIFDEWYCFKGDPNRGEQKAFKEWLKKNPSLKAVEYHKYGLHGNSFILFKN